eukprot:1193320-Prorocentrum_minimum.AAC.2
MSWNGMSRAYQTLSLEGIIGELVVEDAGHFQFLAEPTTLQRSICYEGRTTNEHVRGMAYAAMVAWAELMVRARAELMVAMVAWAELMVRAPRMVAVVAWAELMVRARAELMVAMVSWAELMYAPGVDGTVAWAELTVRRVCLPEDCGTSDDASGAAPPSRPPLAPPSAVAAAEQTRDNTPIAEREREYTHSGHQSQKGRENIQRRPTSMNTRDYAVRKTTLGNAEKWALSQEMDSEEVGKVRRVLKYTAMSVAEEYGSMSRIGSRVKLLGPPDDTFL